MGIFQRRTSGCGVHPHSCQPSRHLLVHRTYDAVSTGPAQGDLVESLITSGAIA